MTAGKEGETPRVVGSTAIKPPERQGFDKIKYFCYDSDNGTFCGRTPLSWLQIFIFYCFYYAFLGLFWFAMFSVFMSFISDDEPFYQLESSLIGKNPGISVKPPQDESHLASSLLYLDLEYTGTSLGHEQEVGNRGYATRMKKLFDRHPAEADGKTSIDCKNREIPTAEKNEYCHFDISTLEECADFPYGYNAEAGHIKPCVFLKVNKIWGLNIGSLTNNTIDAYFPTHLRERARQEPERMYINCEGEYPLDREALKDKMFYFPDHQGINVEHLVYNTKKKKESAFLAVQFRDLPIGQLIHVICKAYYEGGPRIFDKKTKEGIVTFQLLVKERKYPDPE